MKLRHAADLRTLLWALVLFPATVAIPFIAPRAAVWLLPMALYVGFSSGVLAHNHNHHPTFRGRRANALFAGWLSVFYGYPTFVWIPTHNLNHHKASNRAGDASITWRYSKKNTWLVASTYPFVAAYFQSEVTRAFVRRARAASPPLYRQILLQYAAVVVAHAGTLALGVALHGARGILVYLCTLGASAAMGLWGMMFVNFIQHVDCDPRSLHDHSRNFTGTLGNWLVFNAGYHTAHHERPGAHWSSLPRLHAAIAPQIHPDLCQSSIFAFCLRTYVLGALDGRFRTRQIGRAAYE